MAKDFERVVFDAKTPLDTVVGPVETRNGWHLVLVHDRHLADDEAKEKARLKQEALKQERLERAEQQRAYQEHREQRRRERSMRANLKDRETDKHSLHHDEL
jgi:parvulin-like peptidyl-prolyl isomerase